VGQDPGGRTPSTATAVQTGPAGSATDALPQHEPATNRLNRLDARAMNQTMFLPDPGERAMLSHIRIGLQMNHQAMDDRVKAPTSMRGLRAMSVHSLGPPGA